MEYSDDSSEILKENVDNPQKDSENEESENEREGSDVEVNE